MDCKFFSVVFSEAKVKIGSDSYYQISRILGDFVCAPTVLLLKNKTVGKEMSIPQHQAPRKEQSLQAKTPDRQA